MQTEISYKFEAAITLLSTKEGGRSGLIYSDYKPNITFNNNSKKMFCCNIVLVDRDELLLGEHCNVVINTLMARTISKNLTLRDTFTLQEGDKLIGYGIINKLQKTEEPFEDGQLKN
jgi:translation elongation factor EF-Tu-like GTPase